MTIQTLSGGGIWIPDPLDWLSSSSTPFSFANAGTVDAAGEMIAFIGYVYIDGRPASAKTLSSTGGKIHWRAGTTNTFANAASNLRVGMQDVTTGAGPPGRPDETWTSEPQVDHVGGTYTITNNGWQTSTIASGSRSIAHGSLQAVVFDLTARGGTDSVTVSCCDTNGSSLPTTIGKAAGAWGGQGLELPNCVIEFDDGTLGWFDGGGTMSGTTATGFVTTTNPDERALIFQWPVAISIDALRVNVIGNGATADFRVRLYSDPLGTPSAMETFTIDNETCARSSTSGSQAITLPFSAVRTLSANADYAIAVKALGAGTVTVTTVDFANANYRKSWPQGTNFGLSTRNDDTGAFAAVTTTSIPFGYQFRISGMDDGAGGGSVAIPVSGRIVA